jgi:transcriptional regulator with XRE-family HTH domain
MGQRMHRPAPRRCPAPPDASELERGEYSPSLYLALRIAAYFGVPVEVVFAAEPFPRLGAASAG